MLMTIALILLILWLLGFLVLKTALIHALLVVVLVLVAIRLLKGPGGF